MSILRALDIDDLLLLRNFAAGDTITEAARRLNITQPAVSQRIRKLEDLLECKLLAKSGRNRILTQEGRDYAGRASKALTILEDFSEESTDKVVNVGTRPEVGKSWLWSALKNLKKKSPHITYHIHFASGEEIIRNLGSGNLDAIITSAPVMLRSFASQDLAKEDYVFVAKAEIAARIKNFSDLADHILIEHDRSFPFLNYASAEDRTKLKFGDVWFVGSSYLMVQAVASGLGVGIVPDYLAAPLIKTKKLSKIKLKLSLDHDYFRLLYTKSQNIAAEIDLLADELRRVGLK